MARWWLALVVPFVAFLLVGCPSSPPGSSEARIESFTSSAVSVSPGASVTLSWRAVNTESCWLQSTVSGASPDAAESVSCTGSSVVSPAASTTYRFSALKRDGVSYVWADVVVEVGAVADSYPYGDAGSLGDEPVELAVDGVRVLVPALREGALASVEVALVDEPVGVVTPLAGFTQVLALRFSGDLDFVGASEGEAPVLRLAFQPSDAGVASVSASAFGDASAVALVWVRVDGGSWVPLVGMARWDGVAEEFRVSAAHVFEACVVAVDAEAVPESCEFAWQVVDAGALVAVEDAIELAGVAGGVSLASTMPTATGLYKVNLDAFLAAGESCEVDRLSAFLVHENDMASWRRSARTAVVFVHGWQSVAGLMKGLEGDEPLALPAHCSNWESFLSGVAGAGGPWASLRANAEVFTFRYNSNQRVADNGDLLAGWLPQLQALGYERVLLVAHSMGGLVVHDARERVFLDGSSGLGAIDLPVISLATPYMGGPLLCTEVEAGFCQAADSSLLTTTWGLVPVSGMWSTLDLSTALNVSALQRLWMGHQDWLGFALPYERNPYLLDLWGPVNLRDPSLTAFVGSSFEVPLFVSSMYTPSVPLLSPGWGMNDGIVPLASGRASMDLAYLDPLARLANVYEFGRDHGFMTSGCGDHYSGRCPSGTWTDDVYLDAVAERMLAYTLMGDGDISVVVAPESVTLAPGGSRQFTATVSGTGTTGVTWSSTCGSVAGSGGTVTYTAPASDGTCFVRATSVADVDAWGEATVTVTAAPVVTVSVEPSSVTLPVNGAQSFTATVTGASDTSVTWAATCGSLSGSGNTVSYTAPGSAGECEVTATSVADSTKSATASVTVTDGGAFEPAPSYITIENVTLGGASGGTRRVSFDISWDESWRGSLRPSWVAASDNWDAAWVFVKYRVSGGAWQHATLAGSGHAAPAGSVVSVPGDRMGAFVYRSSSGYGTFAANGVGLQWDYLADGVSAGAIVEVQPFGIEMVFVPQGSFSVGSGGSSTGEFRAGGTSNTPFVVSSQSSISLGDGSGQLMWTSSEYTGSPSGSTNASFPTGFGASYVMKYEVTQGQYVDFLNTLTQAQADVRKRTEDRLRYAITGSAVGSYATSLPYVAMNWISWADGAAFADWAGLRPLTELEFEKVARGPLSPVANEYAWGSTSITYATGLANAGTITEMPTPAGANVNGAADTLGPVRVGSFAAPARSRRDAGAGYYGTLELSGNGDERPVTVGNAEGRAFAGTHGDGVLDAGGNANAASWPGSTAVGAGLRGGYHYHNDNTLRLSSRHHAALTYATRFYGHSWRGARSAP